MAWCHDSTKPLSQPILTMTRNIVQYHWTYLGQWCQYGPRSGQLQDYLVHLQSSPVLAEHIWPYQCNKCDDIFITLPYSDILINHCPASRTTLVATRFRVAVICPIIQVPHCIRVFFYFVWFVFINHIFQFYYELCTYCDILDIYLS